MRSSGAAPRGDETPPINMDLVAGGNNVVYYGDNLPIDAAFGTAAAGLRVAQAPTIESIWHLDLGANQLQPWSLWAPVLPAPLRDFAELQFAETYFITVLEPLGWDFPPCVPPEPPDEDPVIASIAGEWDFLVTVTRFCVTEPPWTARVKITQDESVLTLDGLGGPNVWDGTFDGSTASFGGDRPEDGGITSATWTLTLSPDGQVLEGIELWSWNGPGGPCLNGEAVVTATRVVD